MLPRSRITAFSLDPVANANFFNSRSGKRIIFDPLSRLGCDTSCRAQRQKIPQPRPFPQAARVKKALPNAALGMQLAFDVTNKRDSWGVLLAPEGSEGPGPHYHTHAHYFHPTSWIQQALQRRPFELIEIARLSEFKELRAGRAPTGSFFFINFKILPKPFALQSANSQIAFRAFCRLGCLVYDCRTRIYAPLHGPASYKIELDAARQATYRYFAIGSAL